LPRALPLSAGAQIGGSDYFIPSAGVLDILPIHQATLMLALTSDMVVFSTLVANGSWVQSRKCY
jgi:hypothetical protein